MNISIPNKYTSGNTRKNRKINYFSNAIIVTDHYGNKVIEFKFYKTPTKIYCCVWGQWDDYQFCGGASVKYGSEAKEENSAILFALHDAGVVVDYDFNGMVYSSDIQNIIEEICKIIIETNQINIIQINA